MKRKLYCYSYQEFNDIMEKLKWKEKPDKDFATISITSELDDEYKHYFNDNVENNINLNFDDVSPTMWWENKDYYDKAFELYQESDDLEYLYLNFVSDVFDIKINHHAMNYSEAFKLCKFIDKNIKEGNNIFVHCSAGASRSQGVVRYILDTYPEIEWETRDENPCLTPNYHVVRMLKRAYRYLNKI